MSVLAGTSATQGSPWGKDTLAWASLHEPCLKPIWIAIMKTGCVAWRTRLLDVGCGTGGALMLGRGLGASLAGIDRDEERVHFTHNRVRTCDVRPGDLEKLPFVDDCCTFVMSTDLVSFPREGVKLIAEMCRVAGPNAKLAAAVWGDPARCDQADVFEALGFDQPFRYSSEKALGHLIAESGGKPLRFFETESVFEYPNIEAAWVAHRQLGWGMHVIAERGPASARAAFLGVARRYTDASGRVSMRNHFRFALLSKS